MVDLICLDIGYVASCDVLLQYQVITCGCWEAISGSPRGQDGPQQPLLEETRNSCSVPIYTGSRADLEVTISSFHGHKILL